ncbi:hypothetical protein COU76_00535 [Candidatus Peregrinibacteria bacterium CG10_big_fil_rev_8_21_14_0_10_49_10]|nr:MAG: hypothetical protein COU76_00535 [Candidatus Peregrinibacteria bacterium CG10_big_fil_rev_8_21_14_0_10_49_10]
MKRLLSRISPTLTALLVSLGTTSTAVQAAVYGGGGLGAGASEAGNIVGRATIRERVVTIIKTVLSFMALAAVVVIVIAGILMVFSGGEEEAKDRAKRIIFYAVIGLIIILLAQGIVQFMANLPN